jgi:sugar lactone lactonase YvrE
LGVTTLAGSSRGGSDDGTGTAARFSSPAGVALDASGNLYVADSLNYTIRKVTPAGTVTTLAGLAGQIGRDDGTGNAARFYGPLAVAVDPAGNVYAGDGAGQTVRKITPDGVVTTFAGMGGNPPNDGTGSAAGFFQPSGMAADSVGNIYVSDGFSIRKITSAAVVTTLMGQAFQTGSDDGTGGAARFGNPQGLAVDSSSNVYVADAGNNTIRKITPAGVVTTLAGLAGQNGVKDGIGNTARFSQPYGVAVDSAGNVFVADTRNNLIREITPAGVVTTLAGWKPGPGNLDGGLGCEAEFSSPIGVAVDSAGNVYISDGHNRITKGMGPSFSVLHFDLYPPCSETIFDGLFHVLLTGPHGNAVVEASANLQTWTPIERTADDRELLARACWLR